MTPIELPDFLQTERSQRCNGCGCGVNVADPCATCPKKRWGPLLCQDARHVADFVPDLPAGPQDATPKEKIKTPPLTTMMASMMQSASSWAAKGMRHTSEDILKTRLEACHSCEFWNPQGFKGTGRCMKCGCSTWAKLRMATEKCPIGKW